MSQEMPTLEQIRELVPQGVLDDAYSTAIGKARQQTGLERVPLTLAELPASLRAKWEAQLLGTMLVILETINEYGDLEAMVAAQKAEPTPEAA